MTQVLIILVSIIIVYAFMMAIVFFIQQRLIFLPVKLNKDYKFIFNIRYEEYYIEPTNKIKINTLLFKSTGSPKGLIIYFHGNATNLQRWGKYAVNFTSLGYDVLMPDYRGFGKSSGFPTEKILYEDAKSVWDWAQKTFNYKKKIIYGRSLGAAVAANLAGKVNSDMLIMETPFDKINKTMPGFFIPFKFKYSFDNTQHLKNVNCKKAIFHGTMDLLIPLSSTMRLKPFLKENDEMIIIKNGRHRNLNSFSLYHEGIKKLLQ